MNVLNQSIEETVAMYNGDCVELSRGIPDNSIHYTIFSPPFSDLYTYSDSDRDMGNSFNDEDFFKHFKFLVDELYRITMPGRLVSFHCMDLPATKQREGFIGLKDFPGELIRVFEDAGFHYHSRVTIWKDPLVAAVRTKAIGLLHKQIVKDSSLCRQGIADYLITMRKPGDNEEPIAHPDGFTEYIGTEPIPGGVYSHQVWRRYASPVWMDIDQSRTLNSQGAKDQNDEKHICLAKGTLVLTKRGYIPIEDIQIGDETLTHEGRWKKIIAKALTKQNTEVLQVKAIGVPNLILTPDHKLLTKRQYGKRPKENIERQNPEWVESQDTEDKYLCCKYPPIQESKISEQEWWIIGRWLADGHIDFRGHQFIVSIGDKKIEEFKEKAEGHIGCIYKKEGCYQIGLIKLSKECRDFLKKCGKGAANKVVPYEGISLNPELSKAFFDGYMSGDGHVTKSGKIQITSISRPLLLGMAIVAHNAYGYSSAIYSGRDARTKEFKGRKVNCKQEWELAISPHHSFNLVKNKEEWKKVKSVIQSENTDVYSIQVEDDASFTAEGCIVKNCPLQLDVIERAINLWTNKGDIVLDPFAGIGSTAYCAIKSKRRSIGFELKKSYYDIALQNIELAKTEMKNKGAQQTFIEVD